MTNELLNAKAILRMELEAQKKALEAQIKAIDAELQSELDSRQVDKIETGMFNIFWKLTESQVLNQKKIKEEYPDIVAKCTESQVKTYFKVNQVK